MSAKAGTHKAVVTRAEPHLIEYDIVGGAKGVTLVRYHEIEFSVGIISGSTVEIHTDSEGLVTKVILVN